MGILYPQEYPHGIFLGNIDTISEIMIFSKVFQILIFYHFAEDQA